MFLLSLTFVARKVYLIGQVITIIKEVNLFIRSEDLSKVTDIFMKYKVGMTFFDVNGTGRTPRDAPGVIHSYSTRRTTIPKFVQKIEVKMRCTDSSAKQILDDQINSFGLH